MSFCLLTKSHRCIATTLRLMINSEEVLYKPTENSIYIYLYILMQLQHAMHSNFKATKVRQNIKCVKFII